MNILFLGDIVARSGREKVLETLPALKEQFKPDVIIANAENAAHGFGINKTICEVLFRAGINVITTGNHIWDQKEALSYITQEPRLLRPGNYPSHQPGKGLIVVEDARGRKVAIVNLACRLFMDFADNPFEWCDSQLKNYNLGGNVHAIFVDLHGEASSEKLAIAHHLDGRISALVGTHTHIPTADAHILPKGTGYQTDAGMCGDYQSIIGMQTETSLNKMRQIVPRERLQPASGEATVCGTFIKTNDQTGLCEKIESIIVGPHLRNTSTT